MTETPNKLTEAAKIAGGIAVGSVLVTLGCALQCVLSAIPVVIGIFIIMWLLKSCGGH